MPAPAAAAAAPAAEPRSGAKLELGVVACGGPGVGHRPNVYTAMCVPKRARATADQAKKHRYRRTGHSISNQKASTSYTDIEGAFIDIEKSSISGYNDIEVLNFDIDVFFDIGI